LASPTIALYYSDNRWYCQRLYSAFPPVIGNANELVDSVPKSAEFHPDGLQELDSMITDTPLAGGRHAPPLTPVFAGHSDRIAALGGRVYDIRAAAGAGAAHGASTSTLASDTPAADAGPAPFVPADSNSPTTTTHEPSRLGHDDDVLAGGLVEIFAPPLEPPTYRRTGTGFEVDYPPPLDRGYALAETVAGIGALLRAERAEGTRVRLVRSAEELMRARHDGELAAVLHLADADSIDEELDTLYLLHEAGVRSIAITWSRRNAFGYGAPYRSPASPDIGPGLTESGIRLVRACNELGVMIDLAHLNEAGFVDVARHSTAPLVVTHGAAHALSPTSRALTDRQLDAIADSGGVVGVSLEGPEVRPEERVNAMVRQIDYLVDRIGVESVALGSDLYVKGVVADRDGASRLPELLRSLHAAGYDFAAIARIAYDNWMRVLSASW
jgi:membrane dipeptidase